MKIYNYKFLILILGLSIPLIIPPILAKESTNSGFIKIREGHFIVDVGTPFYVFGVNYRGHYDRYANMWDIMNGKDLYDINLIEQDFILAKKAGFNVLNFALGGRVFDEIRKSNKFDKLDAIINLAKKYKIYLLISNYNYYRTNLNFYKDIIPTVRKIHEHYRDESIIFAFSLYPELHVEIYPRFFDLWRPIVGGNTDKETLYNFIKPQVDAIRSVDKNHLLTFDYGFMKGKGIEYASLPVNNLLDFISIHVYNKEYPTSDTIFKTIRYGEKINSQGNTLHNLFPKHPIIYGEFGYPNIQYIADLKKNINNNIHDTANWEVATILYLYSQYSSNFGGAMKWQLTDVYGNSPFVKKAGPQHYNFGVYKIPEDTDIGQKPKPIYYAARILSKYFQTHPVPSASLKFDLLPDNASKIKYIFEEPDALFVSAKDYSSPKLDFSTDEAVSLVFITNMAGMINLQVTASTEVALNSAKISALEANGIRIISRDEGGRESDALFTIKGNKIRFTANPGYEYFIKIKKL